MLKPPYALLGNGAATGDISVGGLLKKQLELFRLTCYTLGETQNQPATDILVNICSLQHCSHWANYCEQPRCP